MVLYRSPEFSQVRDLFTGYFIPNSILIYEIQQEILITK